MSEKVYSGIRELPRGNAPETVTEGCLVLEGGAFRGVYTNGVLDVLMQAGINLRTVYGVSAGALNAVNYVAGQIGRSGRFNLRYRHDSRYVGKDALKTNRGLIGFDFAFGDQKGVEKLNTERLMSPERELYAVATCLETGKAEAFEKGSDIERMFAAVQASASMPYLSSVVEIDGRHYLDGGCACKIPHRFALGRDFEKIVVVRTRTRSYRKKLKTGRSLPAARLIYKDYPDFCASLERERDSYNRQCDELELLEAKGRILVIAPSEELSVSRLEGDMEKLGALYHLGYDDAEARLEDLKRYLGI